jgi:hypothetical protein
MIYNRDVPAVVINPFHALESAVIGRNDRPAQVVARHERANA